ncbi:MAG: DUF3367 domain-containing protein [Actinobacteria bacterium]|nr:DUF3367 domain-containing protein [Actinomycetota bacterium]
MSQAPVTARPSRWSYALLAAIAYLPALLAKPGRMPSDTKLFLYLDPGRLMADAPYTWDTRQFAGWVPHQTIAYLWPQGPWYWVFDKLGAPDWIAHRLWIGTLLLLAALGVYWAARLLGLPKTGALVAAVVYQLSPYILPYISRTSAMLLPWAAVGWLVGLTIRATTSDRRWRHPALIALVLATCSAVNATAVMMIAPAPILWLLHAIAQRAISRQRAMGAALRIAGLGVAVSLWWMAMLRVQGTHGADVLAYSESLQATSLTSVSTETLRGAGYWLFYIRDPYAFTTSAAQAYMQSVPTIAISFIVPLIGVAGIALTRWSARRYAALLVFVGIVLAVGVHPIADASPLMSPLAENSRSSLALALRSSARALPMSNFGLALGAGALVAALATTRLRVRAVAPVAVILLAIVNLPALFGGGLVDSALERDESPPPAWREAADALSASSAEFRVLQLPGAEFGAFRWGYTVDPPLPGMTTKPIVTRDLLPLGSAGAMDLLYALDDRLQEHTLDPRAIAAIARFLAADTIWLTNDAAFDRFRTPRPEEVAAVFEDEPTGLGQPVPYGDPKPNTPDVAMLDETALTNNAIGEPLAPVELVPVREPIPIVRAATRVVVLVGSGDGVVDAAAAGLLHGDEALVYAADLDATDLQRTAGANPDRSLANATLILTDSNRDRAHHWRSSQDVSGFTESGGATNDVLRTDEADQRLPVFGSAPDGDDQTVAYLDSASDDALIVRASGYGEPFAYRPEQRPAMAVDGDPLTAWVVGDHGDPVGHFLTVSDNDGALALLQPQDLVANRQITSIRITAGTDFVTNVALGDTSLREPGQVVTVPAHTPLTITITGIASRPGGTAAGLSGVGFAELGLGSHKEVVRLPTTAVAPTIAGADAPMAIVLTRLRVDPRNRWRSDPEPTIEREFTLPAAHDFALTATLHRNDRASDAVLDSLDRIRGATANRRLTGVPAARGRFAVDGDSSTAWTSPFGQAVGSTLFVPLNGTPLTQLTLQQVIDDEHAVITAVQVTGDDNAQDLLVPTPDGDGRSTLALPEAITSDDLSVTITAASAAATIDRRFGEPITLPVAIRELSSPSIRPAVVDDRVVGTTPTCNGTLLSIDGEPVPLLMTIDDERALAVGETITVPSCSPTTRLDAGEHRLGSANGLHLGIDVDQVVLTDDSTAPDAQETPVVTVERTRTTRTATVSPCPSGCWLIMGEGFNTGWSATVEGASLGAPLQIAGGFNGWWLSPSTTPTTVSIGWDAQAPVSYALLASAAAVLCCIGLAVGRRPRCLAAGDHAPAVAPPRFDRAALLPVGSRAAVTTAALLVAATALVVPMPMALAALAPAAAVVAFRRPLLAGLAAVVLMALLGAAVTMGQLVYRFGSHGGWPTNWDRVHGLGLLVVTLLLAVTFHDRADDL